MEKWQLFNDASFALQFKYPSQDTGSEPVHWVENQQEGMLRVHILSPKSREVYFEVSKYDSLTAESEYQRHKEFLPTQFRLLAITELKETHCASLPACEYTFEWDQGIRTVMLVERDEATYRILYNPRFSVNLEILSTVQWLSLT
jgi:hypothetical protein